MNILFIGDIFGSAGRKIVREHIGHVREAHAVDLTVINAENAAGGFGVTPQIAEELFDLGADVLTTGNHVWDKRELIDYMNSVPADSQSAPAACCARPTFSPACPATASTRARRRAALTTQSSTCMGRVFMNGTNDPFHAADDLLAGIKAKVILVDFHAEATSEKVAMGWHLDGRVPLFWARTPTFPPPTSACCPAAPPTRPTWA